MEVEVSEADRIKEQCSLTGKICTNPTIGKEVFRTTLEKLWKISNLANFTKAGKNTFIISFATKADKQHVMDRHPWLYDNHLLILNMLEVYFQPLSTRFEIEVFWVQLHNLPMMCMNPLYGRIIGKTIEKVMD